MLQMLQEAAKMHCLNNNVNETERTECGTKQFDSIFQIFIIREK